MLEMIIKMYRVRDWIKTFGICILALIVNKIFLNTALFFIAILQSICLFSFLFIVDDFNDALVERGKKSIVQIIEKKKISFQKIMILIFIPFLISFFISIIFFSPIYFVIYLLFLFFAVAYSLPKIRMDDRPFFDVFFNIIFFSLIFIQSVIFAGNSFSNVSFFLLVWFALYIFSLELIHQIAHFSFDSSSTAIFLGKKRTLLLIKLSFILAIVTGVSFFLKFPDLRILAVIMTFFSITRLIYSIRFSEKTDFKKMRDKMGGLVEGILYLLIVLIQSF